MSEFAQLIKDAAGEPPRPLDMAAVRHRAGRLGMRRRARVGLWTFVAVLGIGVPTGVGLSLVPANDRPAELRVIDSDERSGTDKTDRAVTPAVGASRAPVRGGPLATTPGIGKPADAARRVAALGLSGKLGYSGGPGVDGGKFHILDLTTGRDNTPGIPAGALSPDGSMVAYVTDETTAMNSLRVVGVDGRGDRQVYALKDRRISQPAWSPDGRQFAFVVSEFSAENFQIWTAQYLTIWVVNADGTGARRITEISTDGDPSEPAWAPDGKSLAYTRSGPAVYVFDFESRAVRAVATGGRPTWASDSKRIAVARQAPELWESSGPQDVVGGGNAYPQVIDIVNVENGSIEWSIRDPRFRLAEPTWSRDGSWIAFVRWGVEDRTGYEEELFVVRADGRDISVLAKAPGKYGGLSSASASSR